MQPKLKVCVIGAESWGSAIATAVGANVTKFPQFDQQVKIYVYDELISNNYLSEVMNETHENIKYLPGINLPKNLLATNDLIDATAKADIIIFATPQHFIKSYMKILTGRIKKSALAISLIKGVEKVHGNTIGLYSHVISKTLEIPCYTLMGANCAMEMAQGKLCEVTIGCNNREHAQLLRKVFQTDNIKVVVVDDVDGVELCAALKDIVAVGTGLTDGLKLGDNARVAVLHLGLKEMMRFVKSFYPATKLSTFFDSCGVADLVATCYADKNVKFAKALVTSGKTLQELESNIMNGKKLLGPLTAKEVNKLLRRVDMENKFPLFTAIHKICVNEASPETIVDALRHHPDLSGTSTCKELDTKLDNLDSLNFKVGAANKSITTFEDAIKPKWAGTVRDRVVKQSTSNTKDERVIQRRVAGCEPPPEPVLDIDNENSNLKTLTGFKLKEIESCEPPLFNNAKEETISKSNSVTDFFLNAKPKIDKPSSAGDEIALGGSSAKETETMKQDELLLKPFKAYEKKRDKVMKPATMKGDNHHIISEEKETSEFSRSTDFEKPQLMIWLTDLEEGQHQQDQPSETALSNNEMECSLSIPIRIVDDQPMDIELQINHLNPNTRIGSVAIEPESNIIVEDVSLEENNESSEWAERIGSVKYIDPEAETETLHSIKRIQSDGVKTKNESYKLQNDTPYKQLEVDEPKQPAAAKAINYFKDGLSETCVAAAHALESETVSGALTIDTAPVIDVEPETDMEPESDPTSRVKPITKIDSVVGKKFSSMAATSLTESIINAFNEADAIKHGSGIEFQTEAEALRHAVNEWLADNEWLANGKVTAFQNLISALHNYEKFDQSIKSNERSCYNRLHNNPLVEKASALQRHEETQRENFKPKHKIPTGFNKTTVTENLKRIMSNHRRKTITKPTTETSFHYTGESPYVEQTDHKLYDVKVELKEEQDSNNKYEFKDKTEQPVVDAHYPNSSMPTLPLYPRMKVPKLPFDGRDNNEYHTIAYRARPLYLNSAVRSTQVYGLSSNCGNATMVNNVNPRQFNGFPIISNRKPTIMRFTKTIKALCALNVGMVAAMMTKYYN